MDINSIKANLQIIGTRVRKLEIENDYVHVDLTNESISRELDVHYEIDETFEIDANTIAKTLILYVEAIVYDESNTMKVLLEMDGGFFIENSINEEELSSMITINGSAALYSIARGIISSVTSQICTNGTMILPMVNMFDMKEKMEHDRNSI